MNRLTMCMGLLSATASLGLGWVWGIGLSKSFADDKKVDSLLPVPDALGVPANQSLLLKMIAKGTQTYVCKAKPEDANAFAWTLKGPEAQLFDAKGQSIGTHYAGPTWELTDRSKVIGNVKSKVNAPEPENIPWLLLTAKSHEGSGVLTQVNWVQRLNTVGGQAAKTGCDRVHLNQELAVDYSADYYFYGTKATSGSPN